MELGGPPEGALRLPVHNPDNTAWRVLPPTVFPNACVQEEARSARHGAPAMPCGHCVFHVTEDCGTDDTMMSPGALPSFGQSASGVRQSAGSFATLTLFDVVAGVVCSTR